MKLHRDIIYAFIGGPSQLFRAGKWVTNGGCMFEPPPGIETTSPGRVDKSEEVRLAALEGVRVPLREVARVEGNLSLEDIVHFDDEGNGPYDAEGLYRSAGGVTYETPDGAGVCASELLARVLLDGREIKGTMLDAGPAYGVIVAYEDGEPVAAVMPMRDLRHLGPPDGGGK